MQKIMSTSCYDAIVIKQQTLSFRSTPFQVVFSSNALKNIPKNSNSLEIYVNQKKIDIPIKINQNTGRVMFQKIYYRKTSILSDSSDISEDESISECGRSYSRQRRYNTVSNNVEKLEDFKNQQAPRNFWQFAWLFNKKKQEEPRKTNLMSNFQNSESNLTKINEQVYEGEQNSGQPLFHLSLCGNELKKKQNKDDILKTFYKHRVQYSSFIKDPLSYLSDANLVVKIDDSIYTWQLGIAILTCRFAYGKQLSSKLIDDIIKNKFTRSKWLKYISSPGITKLDINELDSPIKTIDLRGKQKQVSESHVLRWTKTPPHQIIQKMNLKYDINTAKFVLHLNNNTTQQITMKIFLWNYDQKVIISDIDGTITKSDILGQILSKWIHEGVINLFNEISKRNYKIIYLTARAIGQYHQTKKFLETVEEDGLHLPSGPLFMSPDGYVKSFARQVIYKTPDYLKTKILAGLNQIFPNSQNPIYCGFGNRDTDSIAYLKINIPPQRIYFISEKSVISRQSDKDFVTSYLDMITRIQQFFPPIQKGKQLTEGAFQMVIEENQMKEEKQKSQTKQLQTSFKNVDNLKKKTKSQDLNYDEIPPQFENFIQNLGQRHFTPQKKPSSPKSEYNKTKSGQKSEENNFSVDNTTEKFQL